MKPGAVGPPCVATAIVVATAIGAITLSAAASNFTPSDGSRLAWAQDAAPPTVAFTVQPPGRVLLATRVRFEWQGSRAGLQYRSKLTVPGDWRAGVRYLLNRWSAWDATQSVEYRDFVIAGEYTFTVQARDPQTGAESPPVTRAFAVYFEMPELYEEAVRIDWAGARRIGTKHERYQFLAREFQAAYGGWLKKLEYQLKLLESTVDPDSFVRTLVPVPVQKSAIGLLEWADKGLALSVKRLLAPATLYGVVKALGVDVILIFRRVEANRAASMAILTYHGWKGFEQLAESERRESVASQTDLRALTPVVQRFMEWSPDPSMSDWPRSADYWQQQLPFLSRAMIRRDYLALLDAPGWYEGPHFSSPIIESTRMIRGTQAEVRVATRISTNWMDKEETRACMLSLVLEGQQWRVDAMSCKMMTTDPALEAIATSA